MPPPFEEILFYQCWRRTAIPSLCILVYRILRKMQGSCCWSALAGLAACLQICLQNSQHRLKLPVTGEGHPTSKSRQTLETSGFAGVQLGAHKTLKTWYAVLLSGRPRVRIASRVPERASISFDFRFENQEIGAFSFLKIYWHFGGNLHFDDKAY